ncbi:MAG: C39 family peptidase [Thermoguttaceae bacterium]
MRPGRRAVWVFLVGGLGLLIAGLIAAGSQQQAPAAWQSVLIRNVPLVRQKPGFSGEACAAAYLNHLGLRADQDWVFDQSGLDPLLARGCYTKELATALEKIGFRIGQVWYTIPAQKPEAALESLWAELYADLVAGTPSIICTRCDDRPGTTEHFRLMLGYDGQTDEVIFHDPADQQGAYRRMKRPALLALWPLKSGARQWTVVRLRLEPGRLLPGKPAETFTPADYAQHLMELKKKIPGPGFTIHIQHPFVVIGDDPPERVREYSRRTVKWAVDRLKEAYFQKDPLEILDIWLFRDKESYQKHCRLIFNEAPTTPFGFFSRKHRALVMNIATGGGTLVHEIVHPFLGANFPECPAWLNEGLASLYEQSTEANGQIRGLTNWRLAGLQEAIRKKRLPPFETLCSMTERQFYDEDRGTNYAQARYLCYYLQEQGLLRRFYHQFAADCRNDPTGYETLKAVLGQDERGMGAFQKQWEAFVLKLRYP